MRIAPIGIWARDPAQAAAAAMTDSGLSHPHPVCRISCASFAAAICAGVNGAGTAEMLRVAVGVAEAADGGGPVLTALRDAAAGVPVVGVAGAEFHHQMGWVLIALQNAFFHLAAGTTAEDALMRTVAAGGDSDTNAAIAGALLGSAQGRGAFPGRWVSRVLTCRPDAGLPVRQPRPEEYWPDDLIDLAEALLPVRNPVASVEPG